MPKLFSSNLGSGGGGGGTGDVVGPASSTDNAIARFDGTTGKLIQDTPNATVADTGEITSASLTASRVLVSGTSKEIQSSSVTTTTLAFLDATSSIQTQLNGKQASGNYITALTGEVTASGPGSVAATVTNSAVIGKVLTGYVSGSGIVAATDTILQAIQKLNGNDALKQPLATITTKGDLYAGTGSGTTARLPAGTDGLFLQADSSQSTGLKYASPTGTSAYRSVTTTDSCTTADDVLVLSGASFTETLFTAVGNTGKVLTLLHNGTSFSQLYTLNTTSAQTIGGIASGSYILSTNGESLKIISNGSNWLILEHKTRTAATSYAPTIGAVTTPPTQGAGATKNVTWYRDGQHMVIDFLYFQTNAGTSGSGDYLVPLPGGAIDTGVVTVSTSANCGDANVLGEARLASVLTVGASEVRSAFVYGHNTTNLRVMGVIGSTNQAAGWGSGAFGLGSTPAYINFQAKIPISGWQP